MAHGHHIGGMGRIAATEPTTCGSGVSAASTARRPTVQRLSSKEELDAITGKLLGLSARQGRDPFTSGSQVKARERQSRHQQFAVTSSARRLKDLPTAAQECVWARAQGRRSFGSGTRQRRIQVSSFDTPTLSGFRS
ncbi:unnamed protein product [Tilletia controversa]|nr:unnamed protein product [Tilletia controversa]